MLANSEPAPDFEHLVAEHPELTELERQVDSGQRVDEELASMAGEQPLEVSLSSLPPDSIFGVATEVGRTVWFHKPPRDDESYTVIRTVEENGVEAYPPMESPVRIYGFSERQTPDHIDDIEGDPHIMLGAYLVVHEMQQFKSGKELVEIRSDYANPEELVTNFPDTDELSPSRLEEEKRKGRIVRGADGEYVWQIRAYPDAIGPVADLVVIDQDKVEHPLAA